MASRLPSPISTPSQATIIQITTSWISSPEDLGVELLFLYVGLLPQRSIESGAVFEQGS